MSEFKKRIVIEDLKQLTEKQKQKLREWWILKLGDIFTIASCNNTEVVDYWYLKNANIKESLPTSVPLLNIGQMIELLQNIHFVEGECLDTYISISGGEQVATNM